MDNELLFDYSELRGRIVTKCGTITNFAEKAGIKRQYVCRRLKDGKGISSSTVAKWVVILDIKTEEIGRYFFTPKVLHI